MMNFCTLFDSNYASKGIALYLSLEQQTDDFVLYVMGIDRKCQKILNSIGFKHMIVECIDDVYNCVKSFDDTSPEVLDLKSEINKLSDNEKNIIYARYYNELTQSETSNLLGISQVQVSRNEAKILQKLRDRL